ncbi:MAG: hypothetical protein P1U56_17970 [Saprospiraceae bacterium]|nr:hypothetical protein [Saprospiraceae bacterium]
MNKPLLILLTLSVILGCSKDAMDNSSKSENCDILQNIEDINVLLNECKENLILSPAEIEENLNGQWTLAGIIPVWSTLESTPDCLILTIDNQSLTLKNLSTNEEITSTWNLKTYDVNDDLIFLLEPDNQELRWSVGMQYFSKNIMYGAGYAFDTDTYIFER